MSAAIAMTVAAVQVYNMPKGEWMAYVTFENIGATQHQKPTLEVWSTCGLDAPPQVGDVLMVMPPRVVGRAEAGDVGDRIDGVALVRHCNKCLAVTAFDLDASCSNGKRLSRSGQTVRIMDAAEVLGMKIGRCMCQQNSQAQPSVAGDVPVKPICFGSNPGPQSRAENECWTCQFEKTCQPNDSSADTDN